MNKLLEGFSIIIVSFSLFHCTKNREGNMDPEHKVKSEIVGDLKRIHSVITRALEVTIDKSHSFSLTDSVNASKIDGFVMYVKCFSSMLHAHHLTEDQLAFPYFKEILPDVPYDALSAQHKEMVYYLDKVNAWIDKVKASTSTKTEFVNLNDNLDQIRKIWLPHIQSEEKYFSAENVGAVINMAERVRLGKLMADHSKKLLNGGILMIPFILYNLEPADREIISQTMPWIITKIMVPIILKNKWKPMRPYLL
jgi:hypothetical protein